MQRHRNEKRKKSSRAVKTDIFLRKNRKMQKKKGEKQSRAGECVNDKIKIKTVDDHIVFFFHNTGYNKIWMRRKFFFLFKSIGFIGFSFYHEKKTFTAKIYVKTVYTLM